MHQGKSYLEAAQELFKQAALPYAFGEKGIKTKREYRYPKPEPLNDKTHVYAYLAQRGISKATVDKTDVREDRQGNIVFNYYDTNDVLTLVKYRPSRKIDKTKGEDKNWCQHGADTAPLLFHMNRVNTSQPLLLTEGEIDSLAAIESGYPNTVSVPFGANNYSWIEENFDWLEQFDNIIICSDNDEAGLKMRKECMYRLGSWRTKYIEIPETYVDPKTGKCHRMKDLNEVLYYAGKQAVLDLIANAKDTNVPSVIDLSDVKDLDLDDMDGIQIGIDELDRELMKLFYGTLTLLSGQPGSGKTSFISQLICQSLEQEKNVWMFSKEMPAEMTRSWMNYILAGCFNIREYKNNKGGAYYKVPPEVKDKISKFYQKKWFVYRDDWSNKLDDLLLSMSDCVRKYGTKLLILDNLMMIDLDSNDHNELQKQTDAILKLIKFAMRYSVAVVLVAHPRKMPKDTEVGLYDISGSSNIINLAHRTIGLKKSNRAGEPSAYDVFATIIKDRMRGRSDKKIGLYYDVASRRFYTNEKEYYYSYQWDANTHSELPPYPHTEERENFGNVEED